MLILKKRPEDISNCSSLYLFVIVLGMILLIASSLQASKWKAFTNTNHVYDLYFSESKAFAATWGGVAEYDIALNSYNLEQAVLSKVTTSADGLSSNDVRTIAYDIETQNLWVGTFNDGINVVTPSGIQVYNNENFSISNRIRRIILHNRNIYVATDMGIVRFYYLPGVVIPLIKYPMLNIETTGNGLISNNILDLAASDNGYLFCATESGVNYVHTDSLDINSAWHKWIPSNSPIANNPVLTISVSDSFLVANTKTSIHRHNINPLISDWQTWTRTNGGLSDSIFTVGFDDNNQIIASYGFWDEDTMTLNRKTNYIYCAINSTGNLSNYPPPDAPANDYPAESIFRIVSGNQSYTLNTWGQGIYSYSNGSMSHLVENCIGFQTISEIVTDNDYNTWFSSGWIGAGMTRKGTRGVSKLSDGVWQSFSTQNSPIRSDNILTMAVDWRNRKWFGSWDASANNAYGWKPGANVFDESDSSWAHYTRNGIEPWNEDSGWGQPISGSPRLHNNTILEIYVDLRGNTLVVSSGGGVTVFDMEGNFTGYFLMPESYTVSQMAYSIYHSGSRYFFGTYNDRGLIIWDNYTLPVTGGSHWMISPIDELNNSYIYGVVTTTNTFGDEENWIASSQGLYMWNGTDWYRYDTDIKRRRYLGNGNWDNKDTLYYVDEERLFGSIREARPTTIFLDPFDRIWIGSLDYGITMYDTTTERFSNYYVGKAPLISNYITSFGYNPLSGDLLIGTPEGLNTLQIGVLVKTETELKTVKAYPNPYFPSRDGSVRIINTPSLSMPKNKNVCKIYDASGALIIELKENYYARFDWNGKNKKNKPCSSGIYYFVVTDSKGETKRGKIALIREN